MTWEPSDDTDKIPATEQVLKRDCWLGLDDTELATLEDDGVIGTRPL